MRSCSLGNKPRGMRFRIVQVFRMVVSLFWFSIFGLVRRRVAFDGDDNIEPAWVCNIKIKIFFVIEKILLNFY